MEDGDLKLGMKRRLRKMLQDVLNKTADSTVEQTSYETNYDNRCSICLELIKLKTKPEECRHTFCQDCIVPWTRFSNVCPLCKVEIKWLTLLGPED
jgi:hypothetical protein